MPNTNTRPPAGGQSTRTASRAAVDDDPDTTDAPPTLDDDPDDGRHVDPRLPSTLSVTDSGDAEDAEDAGDGRTTVFCRAVGDGGVPGVTVVAVDHVRRVELSQRGDTVSELHTGRDAERRLPRWLEAALPDDVVTTREIVA